MTAEILVMNLEAVALAADSAVTSQQGSNQKIYETQNKLFALSDHSPIGIMVYGEASMMSYPWETLIKEFRRQHGSQVRSHVKGYAEAFVRYIEERIVPTISEDVQDNYTLERVELIFNFIKDQVNKNALGKASQSAGGRFSTFESLLPEFIRDEADIITKRFHANATSLRVKRETDPDFLRKVRSQLEVKIRERRVRVFGDFSLRSGASQRLNEIGIRVAVGFTSDIIERSSGAGLVVAGFGEDELFPASEEVRVEGVTCGKLKYQFAESPPSVGYHNNASIRPFAQREMVDLFMQGIDPSHSQYLDESVELLLTEFANEIVDNLTLYKADERQRLKDVIGTAGKALAMGWSKETASIRSQTYVQSVIGVVPALPKDQLAEMAESLVNLTSFRRHMSWQAETVGGPIDVAVITKGDGFVWVKRKHYFPPELNPSYFTRRVVQGSVSTGPATENSSSAKSNNKKDNKSAQARTKN